VSADLLGAAEIIPLDSGILRAAAAAETDHRLSWQDAIVLASVIAHLAATAPAESCFLNTNTRDFDDPDIRDRLENFQCKFLPGLLLLWRTFWRGFRDRRCLDSHIERRGVTICFRLTK
jgi:hypothetical protein